MSIQVFNLKLREMGDFSNLYQDIDQVLSKHNIPKGGINREVVQASVAHSLQDMINIKSIFAGTLITANMGNLNCREYTMTQEIKEQYYLVISTAGHISSDTIETEISESDMNLKEVVKRVLNTNYGYGFYYLIKKYIAVDNNRYFSEQDSMRTPFNFVDPTEIGIDRKYDLYDITARNDWATYVCNNEDSIVFTSDKNEKRFKACKHDLKVIRY